MTKKNNPLEGTIRVTGKGVGYFPLPDGDEDLEIQPENLNAALNRDRVKVESLHKEISVLREDFFTVTIGTNEVDIICSSNLENKVLKHFKMKPMIVNHNLAAIGISYGPEVFNMPNTFFSLLSVTARARINIEELVSTPTELIFIVHEKDFIGHGSPG